MVVGCPLPELVDARHLHGVVHPAAHLLGRNAQVLQRESHVFFHHCGNDLVVRVLEHHAHGLADVVNFALVGGVHPLHQHSACLRQEDGVELFGQGGFAAAVGTQHGDELAPLDAGRDPVQRIDGLLRVIAEL